MSARRSYYRDKHRLTLDARRARLGGVCAGLAKYIDVDPFLVRVAALLALWLIPHFTLLAYGVAYLVLEEE